MKGQGQARVPPPSRVEEDRRQEIRERDGTRVEDESNREDWSECERRSRETGWPPEEFWLEIFKRRA